MVSHLVSIVDELPSACAMCDEEEPLNWVNVRGTLGKLRRLAVCAGCEIDLRASDAEIDDDDCDD